MLSKDKNLPTQISFQSESTTIIPRTNNNSIFRKTTHSELLTQKSPHSPNKNLEFSKVSLMGSSNSLEKPENATPSDNLTISNNYLSFLM